MASKTPAELDKEIVEILDGSDGADTSFSLAKRDASGFKPLGHYDLKGGYRVDGSVTEFFGSKARARAAAKSIGWPMNSISSAHTRFQMGFALRHTHGGFLTKVEFAKLSERK